MVSDANAARTDAEHNATLATFYAVCGDVMDTDFLIERLEANAAARAAVEPVPLFARSGRTPKERCWSPGLQHRSNSL